MKVKNLVLMVTLSFSILFCDKIEGVNNFAVNTDTIITLSENSNYIVFNDSNSLLPHNYISSIEIDKDGNKWIGTCGGYYQKTGMGVAKFDGTNWTIYDTSNSDLPCNVISEIAIDKNNKKWFCTYKGLACYDDVNWQSFDSLNSVLGNYYPMLTIAIGKNNEIILGSNGVVVEYDGNSWTIFDSTSSDYLLNAIINDVAVDKLGNKWIGTESNGLIRIDTNSVIERISDSTGIPLNITSITIDSLGVKWIGTINNGVIKYDDITWTFYNIYNSKLPSHKINTIEVDLNNSIWFGAEALWPSEGDIGLSMLGNSIWSTFTIHNKVVNVNAILFEDNKIWIGTEGYGLFQINL